MSYLLIATMEILHHLKILSSVPVDLESDSIFKSVPIHFTSCANYSRSDEPFSDSTKEMTGDDEHIFLSGKSCTHQDRRFGEYSFCETVKVDVAESKDQNCKNQLSSTVSLICILFENLENAIKLHKECADKITKPHFMDPKIYMFNRQDKRDDLNCLIFRQGIINDFSHVEKESFKLLES
jgi:hypothetical protein